MNTIHPATPLSRRQFAKSLALAAAPLILPSRLWSASPGQRINLGFIGIGIQSRGHLNSFLAMQDRVQVVAVCDIHKGRLDDSVARVQKTYAKELESGSYKGVGAYNDFRDLLERKDVDAVVIGTPDHWHGIPAILAARAKKDIYCEKPLSLTIGEGREMVKAARQNKVVFQTGSQQRTEFNGNFRLAVELIRSGRIGKVKTIRIGVGAPNKPCDLPGETLPPGIDWNLWLGPAPMREFNQVLCPLDVHKHFPAWRNYRDYAGGGLADMGAHHFDIAQWALDMDHSGPIEIIPPEDPKAQIGLKYVYANGIEMFHGGPSGCTFEGTAGTLYVDRGKIESKPESILKEPLGAKDFHLETIGKDHRKNWLDCIASRKLPVADVEIGARTASICHLGNIGYQLGRKLKWNPANEQFIGDAEANKLIHRERRETWSKIPA